MALRLLIIDDDPDALELLSEVHFESMAPKFTQRRRRGKRWTCCPT